MQMAPWLGTTGLRREYLYRTSRNAHSIFDCSNCTSMEWDRDGDTLCVVSDKGSTLFMWDANQRKPGKIDSGAKDVITFLCWSKTDLQLALGELCIIFCDVNLSNFLSRRSR